MSALQLVDIRKSFGELEVLKGINLSVEPGGFLVLLGPSGCGKSTLLNIIAGLETLSSGDVVIGEDVATNMHPRDRDVAMVFQSYALYPSMTVTRNITFALEMRGVPKAEREKAAREAAEVLRIGHLLDRKPAQLSGGQRQRVAMGRALVRHPKVFLFDEPLSNLDAQLRTEMRTEIKRLHAKMGITTVYVTHDQVEAMTLASCIAVMNEGRVEQFGSPGEIYERPATRFVANFVGSPAMNFVPAKFAARSGKLFVVGETDGSDREFSLPVKDGRRGELDGRPVTVGIRPESISLATAGGKDASLEVDVDVIEPTGPDTLVSFALGGMPAIARLKPQDVREPGPVRLAFDTSQLHFFDQSTGQRIDIAQ